MDFAAPTLGGAVKAVLLPHLQNIFLTFLIVRLQIKLRTEKFPLCTKIFSDSVQSHKTKCYKNYVLFGFFAAKFFKTYNKKCFGNGIY